MAIDERTPGYWIARETGKDLIDPDQYGVSRLNMRKISKKVVNVTNAIVRNSEEASNKAYWAGLADESEATASRAFDDKKKYLFDRAMDDAFLDRGFDKQTLGIARSRQEYWAKISPRNVSSDFLTGELGFRADEVEALMSSKLTPDVAEARQRFALTMGEYEATSAFSERGQFSNFPGSSFLGSYDSRDSRYITAQKQAGFVKDVFGRQKYYGFKDTGDILRKEAVSKVRIKRDVSSIDTMAKAKEAAIAQKSYLEEMVRLEEQGLAHPVNMVNLYHPGRKGTGMVENSAYEDFMESIVTPFSESDMGFELTEDAVKGLAPTSEAVVDALQGSLESGETYSSWGEVPAAQQAISYKAREGYWQRRLDNFRKHYAASFDYDASGEGAERTRTKVSGGYSQAFKSGFKKVVKSMGEDVRSTSTMSYADIESFLGNAEPGESIQAMVGKKWLDLEELNIEGFQHVMLEPASKGKSVSLAELQPRVPPRARAERMVDIYFRKHKGKDYYGAYTAANTYLGSTISGFRPPATSKARIYFEPGYGFAAGWGPEADTKHLLEMPKEQSLYVYESSRRERRQKDLARMYHQEGADYSLISRYRKSEAAGQYTDLSTGENVSEKVAEAYKNERLRKSQRSYNAGQRFERMSIPKVEPESAWFRGAKDWFKGQSKITKSMLVGGAVASAALMVLGARESKKHVTSPGDVSGSDYAMSTEDQRIFQGSRPPRPAARITPQYNNTRGYTTNIDIQSNGAPGLNNADLARLMDRHAKMVLGTSNGNVNVSVSDNSDNSTNHNLQRKYANMMRG